MKEIIAEKEIEIIASDLSITFLNRRDNHAMQLDNGKYVSTHKPPTIELMGKHLKGEITLGSYILNEQNNAKFSVFDADDEVSFARIQTIGLSSGIPTYIERSRRGGHVWMFYEQSIPGYMAKSFGKGILDAYVDPSSAKVEVFPKQGSSQGPGSIIRVPFGIHRKSGERYPFIDHTGKPLGTWQQQMDVLSSPERIPLDVVERYQLHDENPSSVVFDTESEIAWEQIKKNVDVMNFVGSLIDLRPTRTGGIGLCPFHDDDHPSFGVNKEGNYWHCFAGCGGGSVIDFWMLWRDCDFKTALSELEDMNSIDNQQNAKE